MRYAALTACVLVLLTGCGGRPAETPDAANLVPASASSYLRIRTSERAHAAALLLRFPTRGDAFSALPRVPPGAGPELDVATIGGTRVFFTQPADVKALAKWLDATGRFGARVRGWTVYARSTAALDTVRHARGSLAGRPWYAAAMKALPTRAAIRQIATGWRAAALSFNREDAELLVRHAVRARPAAKSSSSLAALVPADAIAAAGAAGPRAVPAAAPVLLRQVAAAVGGPLVGWVRPDAGLPEVTVVAQPAETRRALRATATLVARLTRNPVSAGVTVDGVRMEEVANGAIDLYYGLVGGKLVVSDSAAAAERITSTPKALPAVSQLPGAIESWAYLDVPAGLPLEHTFSGLFETQLPASTEASIAPLLDILVYSATNGRVATTVMRVGLRLRP